MYYFQLLVASLFVAAYALSGGKNATIQEFPYHVSILRNNRLWCGGAIISENWLLTSGFCAQFEPLQHYTVISGTHSLHQGSSNHTIKEIIQHESHVGAFGGSGDVALMRVSEPFVFDGTRQPIRFFNGNLTMVNITGFGEGSAGLQRIEMPVVKFDWCNRSFKERLPEDYACASFGNIGREVNACYGDYGGPVAADGKLVGVVSWTNRCTGHRPHLPVLYTNVSWYQDWIEQKI